MDNDNDVWLTVRISPAIMVEVVNDTTGHKWDGHYTLGRDEKKALLPWFRLSQTMEEYKGKKIRFRKETK